MAERDPIAEFKRMVNGGSCSGHVYLRLSTSDAVAVAAEINRLRTQLAESERLRESAEARVAGLEAENAALRESDERCEGCNRVATKHDSEGVPLCLPCWQACVDESCGEDEEIDDG